MHVDTALQMAESLKRAAQKAIDEGRSEVRAEDIDTFMEVDDLARQELVDAIKRAG